MLTDAELASLRSAVESILPDTCTLRRSASVPDGQGGVTVSWTETAGVLCRLTARAQGTRGQEGDQSAVSTTWSLLVAYDQDVQAGDEAVVGGETWIVQSVQDLASERTHRRAELRRAQ